MAVDLDDVDRAVLRALMADGGVNANCGARHPAPCEKRGVDALEARRALRSIAWP